MSSAPLLLLLSLLPALALAAPAWLAPFDADPVTLLAEAKAVAANSEGGYAVLLDEVHYSYDEEGRQTARYVLAIRLDTRAALEEWGHEGVSWDPRHESEAAFRGRIVRPDGTSTTVDPSGWVRSEGRRDGDLYDDNVFLEGPVAGLSLGCVYVRQWQIAEFEPYFAPGRTKALLHVRSYRSEDLILRLEAPKSLPFKVRWERIDDPAITRKGGVVRYLWHRRDVEPAGDATIPEPTRDGRIDPWIGWSTAKDWNAVARGYAEWVEERLSEADLAAVAASIDTAGMTPEQVVGAAGRWVQSTIRYTGMELGAASLVPAAPGETLKRGFGDCKDMSTLLVGILREKGVPADVALIRSGSWWEVPPDLPGLGAFDHAIVHVPGPGLFVDPTTDLSQPGELSQWTENRGVLLARPDARKLTPTPISGADKHGWTSDVEVVVPFEGPATMTRTSQPRGRDEVRRRRNFDAPDTQVQEWFEEWAKEDRDSARVVSWSRTDSRDLATPWVMTWQIEGGDVAEFQLLERRVLVRRASMADQLPSVLRAEEAKGLEHDAEFTAPYDGRSTWTLRPPTGFVAAPVVPLKLQVGPLSYEETVREVDGAWEVVQHLRFEAGQVASADLVALRAAAQRIINDDPLEMVFRHPMSNGFAGDDPDATVELGRTLVKQHPDVGGSWAALSEALIDVGAGSLAWALSDRAVALSPNESVVWRSRAWVLQHDGLGRRLHAGFDRPNAIAASLRAVELDAGATDLNDNLALLQEFNDAGVPFGVGADLPGAIATRRAFLKDWVDETQDSALARALLRSGDADGALAVNADADGVPMIQTAAKFLRDGPDATTAAMKAAGKTDNDVRHDLARSMGVLIGVGQNDAALTLLEALGDDAFLRDVPWLGKLGLGLRTRSKPGSAAEAARALLTQIYDRVAVGDERSRRLAERLRARLLDDRPDKYSFGGPYADLVAGSPLVTAPLDGNLWTVRLPSDSLPLVFAKEGKGARLVALGPDDPALGDEVLARLGKGDKKGAGALLDLAHRTKVDRHHWRSLWGDDTKRGLARAAAAVLAFDAARPDSVDAVLAERDRVADPVLGRLLDPAVMAVLAEAGRTDDAAAVAARLLEGELAEEERLAVALTLARAGHEGATVAGEGLEGREAARFALATAVAAGDPEAVTEAMSGDLIGADPRLVYEAVLVLDGAGQTSPISSLKLFVLGHHRAGALVDAAAAQPKDTADRLAARMTETHNLALEPSDALVQARLADAMDFPDLAAEAWVALSEQPLSPIERAYVAGKLAAE